MSLYINTNTSASLAAMNLNSSNAMLQKSLARLSSGSKITSPADDAGGLAVSMAEGGHPPHRCDLDERRERGLLPADAGRRLKTAGNVLERIAELKTLSTDVTKSTTDIANYDTEFTALKAELTNLATGTFNGVALFRRRLHAVGDHLGRRLADRMNITKSDLAANVSAITGAANLAALTTDGGDHGDHQRGHHPRPERRGDEPPRLRRRNARDEPHQPRSRQQPHRGRGRGVGIHQARPQQHPRAGRLRDARPGERQLPVRAAAPAVSER